LESDAFDAFAGVLPVRVARADVTTSLTVNSDLIVYKQDYYDPVQFQSLLPTQTPGNFNKVFESAHSTTISDFDGYLHVAGAATMPAPLSADLNQDGIPDLILPVQYGRSTYVEFWNGFTTSSLVGPGQYLSLVTMAEHAGTHTTNVVSIDLTLPDVPTLTPPVNALEVIIWSQHPDDTPAVYSNVDHICFQHSQGGSRPTTHVIPVEMQFTNFSGGNLTDVACFPKLYWLEIRWAVWDGTTTPRAASPSYIVALGADNSPMCNLAEDGFYIPKCLEGVTDPNRWDCVHTGNNPCGTIFTQSVQNVFAPGTITRRRMGPTGDGVPPTPAGAHYAQMN
jgi:hypothetical protein